jgi:hypothetical protein
MVRFSSTLALPCLLLLAFAPKSASAMDRTRPLREAVAVEPGATCLETATLVEHVESWLGADAADSDVSIEVRGSPDQPRVVEFRTLRAGRAVAYRRFAPGPARCEHLHAALGLAIAMAIRASLIDEVAGTTADTRERAPQASADATQPWAIGANALAAVAVLPGAAFGADVRIERALAHPFHARLGMLGLAALGETLTPGYFDVWLLAPRIDLCAGLELSRRLRGRACMGFSGGALYAHGHGFPSSKDSLVRWFAAVNGLDFTADLARSWSLDLAVGLVLPLVQTSVVIRDSSSGNVVTGDQRALAPVGGFLGVGPAYRF